MMATFLSTLAGVAVGGLVTYFVSRHYYQRSSKELRREAARLRKLIDLVLRGLEVAGLSKFSRDEHGNITNIHIYINGEIAGTSEMSGNLQVGPREDTEQSEESAEQETT